MNWKHFCLVVLSLALGVGVGFVPSVEQRLSQWFFPDFAIARFDLNFELSDYFSQDPFLDQLVEAWYQSLTPKQRVAQLIMPAWEESMPRVQIKSWIQSGDIGGFMILNSKFTDFDVAHLRTQNKTRVPLLIAIDAEPSLLENRMPEGNFLDIEKTADIKTLQEAQINSQLIAQKLKSLGINFNFAPVYDAGGNESIIGNRAFKQEVTKLANHFVFEHHLNNIIATAKHFPGHGSVEGDTHKAVQTIGKKLLELPNFESAIEAGTLVMMVGHLAVDGHPDYDTELKPATLSPVIMQKLLREDLGFEGVIITDAMNMGAVRDFYNADFLALKAGADIVLMPEDPEKFNVQILEAMKKNPEFKREIEAKIKRVLRLKLVWVLSQIK